MVFQNQHTVETYAYLCFGTCACKGGAEEDVDNEHDQQQDGKADAQTNQPWKPPLRALPER